jgi:hypothetical protein
MHEGAEENHKNDLTTQSAEWDLNPGPSEYETQMLPAWRDFRYFVQGQNV